MVYTIFSKQLESEAANTTDWDLFRNYSAEKMTEKQVELFNRVVSK